MSVYDICLAVAVAHILHHLAREKNHWTFQHFLQFFAREDANYVGIGLGNGREVNVGFKPVVTLLLCLQGEAFTLSSF